MANKRTTLSIALFAVPAPSSSIAMCSFITEKYLALMHIMIINFFQCKDFYARFPFFHTHYLFAAKVLEFKRTRINLTMTLLMSD